MDQHHYIFHALPPTTALQRQEYLESMNLVTETMILFLVDSSAKNYVFVHVVTQAAVWLLNLLPKFQIWSSQSQ